MAWGSPSVREQTWRCSQSCNIQPVMVVVLRQMSVICLMLMLIWKRLPSRFPKNSSTKGSNYRTDAIIIVRWETVNGWFLNLQQRNNRFTGKVYTFDYNIKSQFYFFHFYDHKWTFLLVSLNVESDSVERGSREQSPQRATGETLFGFELPSCSFWVESPL